jgi:hypothetical protein
MGFQPYSLDRKGSPNGFPYANRVSMNAPAVLFFLVTTTMTGQTPRIEAGAQLSIIDQPGLGEKPLAGGVRLTASIFRFVDAEAEVNRYPIGGAISNFPATQLLAGTRVGYRIGPIGVYAKVLPGLMRFDSSPYAPALGARANLDVGGVLELYARRYFAVRFDFGDTIIFYGSEPMLRPSGGTGPQPGTRHQLQAGLGVSLWF